ncbi:MAG: GTPase [Myxococcaceae bacterium]
MREALTEALSALPPVDVLPADARIVAERLGDRIRRDLLPRLGGPHPTLIIGIAGPNNVGKSSVFNALVGRVLSPARPEGGLTKQCLAAAHPSLWEGPLRTLIEERYEVIQVAPGELPPVTEPGPPGRLYLVLSDSLPEGVLLMDTPDFDSVHQTNRRAAEALLVTADVVLFLVSRHTYQNAAVVAFLRDVVGHGRPYALLYNEAVREEVALSHLDKLVQDVGHAPVAREIASHQPEVEAERSLLVTQPVPGQAPLASVLRDREAVARLKARALAASLANARAELMMLADALDASAGEPERLRRRIRHELRQVGERAAGLAIPADVLIEAFRDELDARSPTHRLLRKGPRLLAAGLTRVGQFLKAQFTGPEPAMPPMELRVQDAIANGLRATAEALAPEVATWRGDPQTRELLRSALGADLNEARPKHVDLAPETELQADRDKLYRFCRDLLAKEMPTGPSDEVRQFAATFAYTVPAIAGMLGAMTVPGVTGGADVVFASALVTTPLLERFVDLLGAGVRDSVAQAWRRSHGQTLARELEVGAFGELLSRLDTLTEDAHRRSEVLRRSAGTLEVPP